MIMELMQKLGAGVTQSASAAVVASGGAALLLGGCASSSLSSGASTKASYPAPSWVAGPSAPLPEGFPAPGPIGEVIIKKYPACRIAMTKRSAGTSGSGELFMPLFRHIESNDIAMSSPVVMTYNKDASGNEAMASMAFIYGKASIGQDGVEGKVTVENQPPMLVASIGVRGQYTAGRFERAEKKVAQWLASHASQYKADGDARYLAYNSPFVLPWLKYGEVQIPVTEVLNTPKQ